MIEEHKHIFVQTFYPDCPEDMMVGTAEHPAYLVGTLLISENGNDFYFPFPDIILALFSDKMVNIYVEDFGLLRNVRLTKVLKLSSPSKA